MLILNKDFEARKMNRDREGHSMMIKGSIHQDSNSKCIRTQQQSFKIHKADFDRTLKGQKLKSKIIVGDSAVLI